MRILVESCFSLTAKTIKKDLLRAREQRKNVDGFINIDFGQVKTVADYCIEYGAETDFLILRYGMEEQRFKIADSELYFGTRSWFICNCERRVAKLYLPPQTTKFKCRHCHKLTYELNTFNRKSSHGLAFYRTNRMIKMMNNREKMKSYLYNGKPTLRFNRWLKLSALAGYENNIDDAKKLFSAINNYN
ncbi:MAG: hypothetical protein NTZ87_02905 [Candidatus Nomurabacteria bacterium]|nr:hypothetical protein [Candidatus Nomurabacteria bacterium]